MRGKYNEERKLIKKNTKNVQTIILESIKFNEMEFNMIKMAIIDGGVPHFYHYYCFIIL